MAVHRKGNPRGEPTSFVVVAHGYWSDPEPRFSASGTFISGHPPRGILSVFVRSRDWPQCALLAKEPRCRSIELLPIVTNSTNEFARLVARNVMLLCKVSDFVGLARCDLPAIGPAAPLLAVLHVPASQRKTSPFRGRGCAVISRRARPDSRREHRTRLDCVRSNVLQMNKSGASSSP